VTFSQLRPPLAPRDRTFSRHLIARQPTGWSWLPPDRLRTRSAPAPWRGFDRGLAAAFPSPTRPGVVARILVIRVPLRCVFVDHRPPPGACCSRRRARLSFHRSPRRCVR